MTVYIEYVIIDNVIIDYLMLKATFALTGVRAQRGRLFLCAFFGAVVALVYPLVESVAIISVLIKILLGFLLVLLSAKFNSLRSYYINVVLFFAFTFLTGGAIIGVFSILSLPYSSEISVAFMVIPVYFILRAVSELLKFIYQRKDVQSFTYSVELSLNGKTVNARGFYDTGNCVYDGDSPVIVCEKPLFMELIGENILKIKLKKLKVKTVLSGGENFAVKLDHVKIYNGDEPNIFNNVTLMVANYGIGEGYDLILHPALLGGENYEVGGKTKKVS